MNKLSKKSGAAMPRSFMFSFFVLFSLVSDEGIKFLIRNTFELGESKNIFGEFFQFTYIENKGIAFSFMEENPIFLYLLPIIMIVAICYFYYAYRKSLNISFDIGCGLCIGGGLGNLIDRFFFSQVTDFIDVGSFAIFNLADVYINIGIGLICLNYLFFRKEKACGA